MSAREAEGYCCAISSAVAPSEKAVTTLSNVMRVPRTRITPSAPVTRGIASVVNASAIPSLSGYLLHRFQATLASLAPWLPPQSDVDWFTRTSQRILCLVVRLLAATRRPLLVL